MLSFDGPAETDVVRIFLTSAKVFVFYLGWESNPRSVARQPHTLPRVHTLVLPNWAVASLEFAPDQKSNITGGEDVTLTY